MVEAMSGPGKDAVAVRLEPPVWVVEAVARVQRAGATVLAVGGVVRDHLLRLATRDWDFATDLPPAALAALFPEATRVDLGLGAVHLLRDEGEVVFTTFREESEYLDHRHPDRVRFVRSPFQDARRRDFTINALYAGLGEGPVLDPTGGLADLDRRVLRVIGDPVTRFTEDPLRILRAVRFAAWTGFALDPAAEAAVRRCAPLLVHLSAERVYQELTRTFTGPRRGAALLRLVELGLAAVVLPEVPPMAGVEQPPEYHPEGDVLVHTALVLDQVPEGDPVLAWSAVLHDVGKPRTFQRGPDRIRFHGHDALGAEMADAVLRRLHAPREVREPVVEVCRDHIRFASLPEMSAGKRSRWLRQANFRHHLDFHRADCLGSHGLLDVHRLATRLLAELPPEPPAPLISGRDVLDLGVAQGPLVGEILRRAQDEIDRLTDPDRDMALQVLRRIAEPYVERGGA